MGTKRRLIFMRKNSGKHRKWCSIFCTVLLIGSLLSAGCTAHPGTPKETQPTNATETTKASETTETTQLADTTIPTNAVEEPSLVIFRQTMVETPQIFAVAFFGHVQQDADPFAVMREAAPQLCEDLPFLLTIREENIIGTSGYLFCIVPADETTAIAVNRRPWNPKTQSYEEPEVLYRSESGSPILVMCPNEDWIPDTEVILTDAAGTVTVWSPYLDPDYRVSSIRNDKGEVLLFDFTSYEELSGPGWNQGNDSSQLVGTWELVWTEVEGDRIEAAPGVCTIEITPDAIDSFGFTYSNSAFPEENIRNREMIVVPGELYPGCSNNLWTAEVTKESTDTVQYALTLLEDGTLLLQIYWEADGLPMVSYGGYSRMP